MFFPSSDQREEAKKQKEQKQQQPPQQKPQITQKKKDEEFLLDQSRIKDLRTNVETGNTQNVLDGDLDMFIKASLTQGI